MDHVLLIEVLPSDFHSPVFSCFPFMAFIIIFQRGRVDVERIRTLALERVGFKCPLSKYLSLSV